MVAQLRKEKVHGQELLDSRYWTLLSLIIFQRMKVVSFFLSCSVKLGELIDTPYYIFAPAKSGIARTG